MAQKILVTGYGGFLGEAITRRLIDAGYAVRGVARNRYPNLAELGVECIQGDIANAKIAKDACDHCDGVIHVAAKAGVWGRWPEYYRSNTLATSQLLEAAMANNISAFVFTSSPSVTFDFQPQSGIDESVPYPRRWLSFYPQTKALAEQAVLSAAGAGKLLACAIRPHLIWGLNDPHLFPRVIERTLGGRLRRVGDGKNLIDICHVEHAAQAHVNALEDFLAGQATASGRAFFLSDGQPIECWAWISRILQTAGVAVPTKSISYSAAYRIGAMLEAIYFATGRNAEPPMTRFVAGQLAMDHYFDISQARQSLRFTTFIDRDQELDRCKSWLKGIAAKHHRN